MSLARPRGCYRARLTKRFRSGGPTFLPAGYKPPGARRAPPSFITFETSHDIRATAKGGRQGAAPVSGLRRVGGRPRGRRVRHGRWWSGCSSRCRRRLPRNGGCLHEEAVATNRSAASLFHQAEQVPAPAGSAFPQLVRGGDGTGYEDASARPENGACVLPSATESAEATGCWMPAGAGRRGACSGRSACNVRAGGGNAAQSAVPRGPAALSPAGSTADAPCLELDGAGARALPLRWSATGSRCRVMLN